MRRTRSSRLRLTAILSALMGIWLIFGLVSPASAGNYGGSYLNFSTSKSGGYVNWQDSCPFAEARGEARVCSGNNTMSVTDYSDGYRTLFRLYAKGSGTTYYKYVDTLISDNSRISRYLSTMPVGPLKLQFCPIKVTTGAQGTCDYKYLYNS